MDHFIYYDKDYLASINSYVPNVVKKTIKQEVSKQKTEEEKKDRTKKKRNIREERAKYLVKEYGGDVFSYLSQQIGDELNNRKMEGAKGNTISMDIYESTLVHAAFDCAYKYLTPTFIELNDTTHPEIDEFVDITRHFDYFSFDGYKLLFSKDGFLVVLDDKYFKINTKLFPLLFGKELNCFGRVTNIVKSEDFPEEIKKALDTKLPDKKSMIKVVYGITISE